MHFIKTLIAELKTRESVRSWASRTFNEYWTQVPRHIEGS